MRNTIQKLLNEITEIDSGFFIADDQLNDDTTYFGYQIQEDNIDSDLDNNLSMRVTIIGYVVRRFNRSENTLEIVENSVKKIRKKLKRLNFRSSYKDITLESTDYIKIEVSANAYYNEINIKD